MEIMALNGYQTEMAVNGEEGLLKNVDFMSDLIICDIDMPGTSGFHVLHLLRSQIVYNQIFQSLVCRKQALYCGLPDLIVEENHAIIQCSLTNHAGNEGGGVL